MNAVQLYRHLVGSDVVLEFNFYDNKFDPSNLVSRKVLTAMLESVHTSMTHLEVEYNDLMLIDKLGGKAADTLRFLGAAKDNMRENKSGDTVVSRTFRAELTGERLSFFYELNDISLLTHYRLMEGETDRVVYYFGQYLMLRVPAEGEETFYDRLKAASVPYKVKEIVK
ncbi:hypothetical protein [Brevibacillus dissolubilis]|uniref:hypothetical protein n=1 Tax=Brevibacillus dissolubilis TaxID=1844116 RepID=UPI001115D9A1|nr:hypothetical protein [Brevibacillus dissolubilis]